MFLQVQVAGSEQKYAPLPHLKCIAHPLIGGKSGCLVPLCLGLSTPPAPPPFACDAEPDCGAEPLPLPPREVPLPRLEPRPESLDVADIDLPEVWLHEMLRLLPLALRPPLRLGVPVRPRRVLVLVKPGSLVVKLPARSPWDSSSASCFLVSKSLAFCIFFHSVTVRGFPSLRPPCSEGFLFISSC